MIVISEERPQKCISITNREIGERERERETGKLKRKSGKGGSEERMFGFLSPFILITQSPEKRLKREREREKDT